MSVAIATHKAVYNALRSDIDLFAIIADRVYDRVPPSAVMPYLTFEIDVHGDGNTCSDASDAHATVHIWSNALGKVQAEQIAGFVRRALGPDDPDNNLTIDGYVTTVSFFDMELYRQSPDELVTEGVLTFTYLVDPA